MAPDGLLGIPPFFVRFPVAFWLGAEVMVARAKADDVSARRLVGFQIGVAVAALAGAKAYSMFERGWIWQGWDVELASGWRYPGAVIAALAVGLGLKPSLLPRLPALRYADLLALAIPPRAQHGWHRGHGAIGPGRPLADASPRLERLVAHQAA